MGMFDRIDFKMNCPRCKKDMGEFQSKEGECLLATLNYWEVDNFYASCDHCRTWVEYTLKNRPDRKVKLSDYKKEIKKTTLKDDKEYKERMEGFFGRISPKAKECGE